MAAARSHTESRTFRSDTGELDAVREFVGALARDFGFPESDVADIMLAVDEACTNIIKHAYGGEQSGDISISIRRKGPAFSVHILDHGKAFDPDAIRTPNLRKHLTEYRKGGLGVYLMRSLMDSVDYAIRPGKPNEVTLTKILSPATQDRRS